MTLSFLRRLSAASLMVVALAAPALGHSRAPLSQSHDYRFPSPSDLRERVTPLPVSGAKALGSSDRVAYVGFDGKTYELNRFHGRYVDMLLPDAWLGPQALSEEQVQHFVDRTDLIYQFYLDLVGLPPAGDGPDPIAILPTVCGDALGCSWVGSKGVEMADAADFRAQYWQEIAADFPSGVLIHELAHNFDVFSSSLTYTEDGSHGWTTLMTNYYARYSHEGFPNATPEETLQDAIDISAPMFQDPTADWASCIRDAQCLDRMIYPEFAWGGFGLRVALRYGPQAFLGFTSFMRQTVASQQPPATPEDKNDLYLEALAAGAHRDLGCVSDAWHCRVSDSLRQHMLQLYGPNPDCRDRDHDGFSPIQGDCNDASAAVHPGAVERPNHIDDNCNGVVDEVVRRVPAGAAPQSLTLPMEVLATVDETSNGLFQLHMRSPGRVQAALCAEGYAGLGLSSATSEAQPFVYTDGECIHQSFTLGAGYWGFTVVSYSGTFDYSLTFQKAAPWPLPPWARTAEPRRSRNQFVLTAPTALPRLPETPREVRFWVSGLGYVGTVPYSRGASFAWTPPPGVDPVADGLTYRAQVLADGVPIYEITPPQAFAAP